MHSMTAPHRGVTGGVDTHADVHVASALCSRSQQLLGTASFATSPQGYADLDRWLAGHGHVDAVGVEGTGTYGAGLARHLTAAGITVVEVDRPDRAARRRHGKSDPLDAEAAARAVLSGRATGRPKTRDGQVEALRALNVVHRSAVKDRTAASNQFHALVITAPDVIRSGLADQPLNEQLQTVRHWRPRPSDDIVTATTRVALRLLADRISLLTTQIDDTHTRLAELVDTTAPALQFLHGVGPLIAAQLLITFGDNVDRIHSEASLAHLCGVAPIPASSGKTHRHRLNRGGDRQANHALWCIAMVRLASDPRTRAYAQRRHAEGLSSRDIIRCLKRYIAREVYRTITRPPALPPSGPQLRQLRTDAGLTQTELARQTGLTHHRISTIERGLTHDLNAQHQLAEHLTKLTA